MVCRKVCRVPVLDKAGQHICLGKALREACLAQVGPPKQRGLKKVRLWTPLVLQIPSECLMYLWHRRRCCFCRLSQLSELYATLHFPMKCAQRCSGPTSLTTQHYCGSLWSRNSICVVNSSRRSAALAEADEEEDDTSSRDKHGPLQGAKNLVQIGLGRAGKRGSLPPALGFLLVSVSCINLYSPLHGLSFPSSLASLSSLGFSGVFTYGLF